MMQMISCGGIVIHKGKILVLYKDYYRRYVGWVLPKGTVEENETFEETALREVREEAGVKAEISSYIGASDYTFQGKDGEVHKTVHWYLMSSSNFYTKPQKEEHFTDVGYYKYHEAYHLVKYADERYILKKGYEQYLEMRKQGKWIG